MSQSSSPKGTRRALSIALGAMVLGVAVTALFVALEVAGPRAATGQAPGVAIAALARRPDGGIGALPQGARVSPASTLGAQIAVPAPCRVSLVHINVGHGMEALALNVPLQAGEATFTLDGGIVVLPLEGLSGEQRLTAVAALRELTLDEALSAGRGLVPQAVGVATATFQVQP